MLARELVERKIIALTYISTTEQTADILTKALPAEATAYHRDCMLNYGNILATHRNACCLSSRRFADECNSAYW